MVKTAPVKTSGSSGKKGNDKLGKVFLS